MSTFTEVHECRQLAATGLQVCRRHEARGTDIVYFVLFSSLFLSATHDVTSATQEDEIDRKNTVKIH